MDPNWFYSSLAQCAAAIVGLLGAVLVTRLQAQSQATLEHRRELEAAFSLAQKRGRELYSHSKRLLDLVESNLKVARSLVDAGTPGPVTVLTFMPSVGESIITNTLQASREVLARLEAYTAHLQSAVALYQSLFAQTDALTFPPLIQKFTDLPSELGPDGTALSMDMPIRLQETLRHASRLKATSAAPAARAVLGVLLLLCVVGIIIPLGLLSSYSGSSKTVLLLGFAGCLAILLGYIGYQLTELAQIGSTKVTWDDA